MMVGGFMSNNNVTLCVLVVCPDFSPVAIHHHIVHPTKNLVKFNMQGS